MKKLLAILSLAALVSPALALADEPNAPAVSASTRAAFEQVHQKMAALHTQARSQILASLTPAHRAALANLVGQLAIAPNPDHDAAVRQLDALLSPGEKQSVLRIHDAFRVQAHNLMAAARQQMASQMPAGEHMVMKEHAQGGTETPDAGRILLMMSMPMPSHGMHHM